MNRVFRGNKVAVLYSPGFGCGWSTIMANSTTVMFHPKLVELVEEGRQEEITEEFVRSLVPEKEQDRVYVDRGAVQNLKIRWLPVDTEFRIESRNGSEGVVLKEKQRWIVA